MDKRKNAMLRGPSFFMGFSRTIKGVCCAERGLIAERLVHVGVVAALIIFLYRMGPAVSAQAAPFGENEPISFGAEITSPSDPTDALMDTYNKKLQRVMERADPFYAKVPAETYSTAESLKNNNEYTTALKLAEQISDPEAFSGVAKAAQVAGLGEKASALADEALARYEKQYQAMLSKAKAYRTLDQIPEARIMIEKAMAAMGEDDSGIDAAVMALYKEIMQIHLAIPR